MTGRGCCVLLLLPVIVLPMRGELLELAAAADTALLEYAPDFNFGAQADVPAGALGPNAGRTRSRMLIRFDVAAALPADAIIQAAFLRLTVTREPVEGAASTFALHRVLVDWQEGDKQGALPGGAAASPGEATWNQRLYAQVAWSEPGGRSGADFEGAPSATEVVQGRREYEFEFGAKGAAEIQNWLADPAANHGWVLMSQAEDVAKSARRFATREAPTDGPLLMVRFQRPQAQPRITGFEVRGEQMILRFQTETGVGYAWEGIQGVAFGGWETLQSLAPADVAGERALTNAWPKLPHQFFRLRTELMP